MTSRARSQSPKAASPSSTGIPQKSGSQVRSSSEGKASPGGFQSRSAERIAARKSLRANAQQVSGSNKNPIFVDVDLENLEQRKNEKFQAARIKQAISKHNVAFDRQLGRAFVERELKFKNRWYGSERVDEPTAEAQSDMSLFQAVVADLAALYEAFPGECTIVRLRKPIQPGTYSEERNQWMDKLAQNQGEFLRQMLLQCGIPEEDVEVKVQTAPADAPAGMFYFDVPVEGHQEAGKQQEDVLNSAVQRIVSRKNIGYDFHTGRATFTKGFVWEHKNCVGPKMDAPEAKLVNPMAFDSAIKDMAELLLLLKAPARVITEAPTSGNGDPAVEEWCQALGRNRAAVIRAALAYYNVPEKMLISGIFGDPNMSPKKGLRSDSMYAACAASLPADKELNKLHKLKVKAMLQKAAGLHRVEDIPLLEEALEEAKKIHMEEQWSRCDALVSEAEKNLRVLYQRRRRQEAHGALLDRKRALARIKVSQATKQSMIECGEYRME